MNMDKFSNKILQTFGIMICVILMQVFFFTPVQAQDTQEHVMSSRARFHERIGELKEAVNLMEQVVLLYPDSRGKVNNHLYLADLLARSAKYDEALLIYQEYENLPNFLGSLASRDFYYETLIQTQQFETRMKALAEKMSLVDNKTPILEERISMFTYAGNHDGAIAEHEAILQYFPGNWSYLIRFAKLLEDAGYQKRAIEQYLKLLKMMPDERMILEKLGRAYFLMDEKSKGRETLDRLMNLGMGNVENFRRLSAIYQELEEIDDALRVLTQGEKILNNPTLFSIEKGQAYEVQLQTKQAAEFYGVALRSGQRSRAQKAFRDLLENDESTWPAVKKILQTVAVGSGSEEYAENLLVDLAIDNAHFQEGLQFATVYAKKHDPAILLKLLRVFQILREEDLARETIAIINQHFAETLVGYKAWMQEKQLEYSPVTKNDIEKAGQILKEQKDPELRSSAHQMLEDAAWLEGKTDEAMLHYFNGLPKEQGSPLNVVVKMGYKVMAMGKINEVIRLFPPNLEANHPLQLLRKLVDFQQGNTSAITLETGKEIADLALEMDPLQFLPWLFMIRESEESQIREYFMIRNQFFASSNEIVLPKGKEADKELAFQRLLDLSNKQKLDKQSSDFASKTAHQLALMETNSVRSARVGRELLQRLARQKNKTEFLKTINEYMEIHPLSPWLFELRKCLNQLEK